MLPVRACLTNIPDGTAFLVPTRVGGVPLRELIRRGPMPKRRPFSGPRTSSRASRFWRRTHYALIHFGIARLKTPSEKGVMAGSPAIWRPSNMPAFSPVRHLCAGSERFRPIARLAICRTPNQRLGHEILC
jgi:hypothetical protein